MRLTRRSVMAGAAMLLSVPARAASVQRVRLVIAAGMIEADIFTGQAPLSAADFLLYVDRHAYDGGEFSRVVRADNDHGTTRIDVVQGGIRADAALSKPVAHETTAMTGLRHVDGTLSLPRDAVGTGSGAGFFVCIGDQPSLDFGGGRNKDGQGFAAFGRVVAGMDLVRAIWRMDASGPSPDAYTAGQMLRHPVRILSAARV
jgi:peptidyl-prolyl cis-trans isomerase A (cyclophilin A)